jgi:hypothetical protein
MVICTQRFQFALLSGYQWPKPRNFASVCHAHLLRAPVSILNPSVAGLRPLAFVPSSAKQRKRHVPNQTLHRMPAAPRRPAIRKLSGAAGPGELSRSAEKGTPMADDPKPSKPVAVVSESSKSPDLDEKEYFEHARYEDSVINHRLTWLLAGQPLLFLAFANVIPPAISVVPAARAAAQIIPIAGGLLGAMVFIGILGAIRAHWKLRQRRKNDSGWVIDSWATGMGFTPPLVIPLAFLAAWSYIGHKVFWP